MAFLSWAVKTRIIDFGFIPPACFFFLLSSLRSLYSRQRYVLGDNAMHQMAQSSVFLSGMGGPGIEIGGVKLCFYTSELCLTVYSWPFDMLFYFFIFYSKEYRSRRCKGMQMMLCLHTVRALREAFPQLVSVYSVCAGSHPSRHKAVWDLGSGLQLLHPHRRCVESEEKVKYNLIFTCLFILLFWLKLYSYFLLQGWGSVSSSRWVKSIRPRWHVLLPSGRQHWSQLSQKVPSKQVKCQKWEKIYSLLNISTFISVDALKNWKTETLLTLYFLLWSYSVSSWLKPHWAFRKKWTSSATHNSPPSKWANVTGFSHDLL